MLAITRDDHMIVHNVYNNKTAYLFTYMSRMSPLRSRKLIAEESRVCKAQSSMPMKDMSIKCEGIRKTARLKIYRDQALAMANASKLPPYLSCSIINFILFERSKVYIIFLLSRRKYINLHNQFQIYPFLPSIFPLFLNRVRGTQISDSTSFDHH
jgi:hypothetical protein